MSTKSFLLTLGLAVASVTAATWTGPARAQANEPLRIGMLLSLSGPAAPFGIPERDVVEVLVRKLNSEGGINGRKIELSVYDDATNPTEFLLAARRT